jgi:hypothetical protein
MAAGHAQRRAPTHPSLHGAFCEYDGAHCVRCDTFQCGWGVWGGSQVAGGGTALGLGTFYHVAIDCPGYGRTAGDKQTIRSAPAAVIGGLRAGRATTGNCAPPPHRTPQLLRALQGCAPHEVLS